MTNDFDHVVIFAQDLGATGEVWRKLGFRTSPRMYHEAEKGSMNELIMLRGNYIELLGTARLTDTTRYYAALAQGIDGPFMQALRTADVDVEVSRVKAAGFPAQTPDHVFKRAVPLPDGSTGMVRYRAWQSPYPAAPGLAFFGCHHLAPEHLWIPVWQEHPNGAQRLAALTFVDDDPRQHEPYAARALGAAITERRADGFVCRLGDGPEAVALEYVTPAVFGEAFGADGEARRGYCNGITIELASMAGFAERLDGAGVDYRRQGGAVIVRPGADRHTFLRFVAAAA